MKSKSGGIRTLLSNKAVSDLVMGYFWDRLRLTAARPTRCRHAQSTVMCDVACFAITPLSLLYIPVLGSYAGAPLSKNRASHSPVDPKPFEHQERKANDNSEREYLDMRVGILPGMSKDPPICWDNLFYT